MKYNRILIVVLSLCFMCSAHVSAQSNRTEEENREIAHLSSLLEDYKEYSNKEKAIDEFLYEMEHDMPATAAGQYFAALMAGYLENFITQLTMQNAATYNMLNMGAVLQKAAALTDKQMKLNAHKIFLLQQAAEKGQPEAIAMLQTLANQTGNNMYKGYNSNSTNHSSSTYNETCSFCKGKGWRAGSSGSTYGLSGQTFCKECDAWVNQSHSHDICPSCGGKGYRTRTR